jgi:hypothetical protein
VAASVFEKGIAATVVHENPKRSAREKSQAELEATTIRTSRPIASTSQCGTFANRFQSKKNQHQSFVFIVVGHHGRPDRSFSIVARLLRCASHSG